MSEAGGEPKQPPEVVRPPEVAETDNAPVEQQSAVQEASAGKQATPPALQLPAVIPDVAAPTLASPAQDDNFTSPVVSPKTSKLLAAEKDLIEKQWVEKAKEIVAETRSDPYQQKNEMSKAKADYIHKRFKKVVKTDDAVAA